MTTHSLDLTGQIALVTGASSGIGASIAQHLAVAGATVGVNYRADRDEAEAVISKIAAAGGKAIAIQADVSVEAQVQNMFAEMIDQFGFLDIMVNNAGLQQDAAFVDMTLDQWNTVIEVNLTGSFLCAREAVRQFKKQGIRPEISCAAGKLIFNSSVHEIVPWAGHVNYATSKGGINMLMQSIAQEMAPDKIRSVSVAPGAIKTDINRSAWETQEAEAELLKLIPANRVGEVEDIAKAVTWLASDQSDYITGTTIFVDGGMTLYPGFATGG